MACSFLAQAFTKRSYYFSYNHYLLFVVGLIFGRFLTESAIIDVLMLYFTDHGGGLIRSTNLSNIQDALSSLFSIVMAHLADSFVGRFRTVLFSTSAYIGGLMLLWMFNPYDVTWLVVVALVLLVIGTSGGFLLQYMLCDLLHKNDNSSNRNETRSNKRAEVWWKIIKIAAAITSNIWVSPFAFWDANSSWKKSFLICIIIMTSTLIVFWMGHNVYHQSALRKRPVQSFFRVLYALIQPKAKTQSPSNTSRQERSPPQPVGTNLREDMVVVKSLLRIFPMWATFFVVALISATGSTFFLEQYSNLNTDKLPANSYSVIQDFSGAAIVFLYHFTPIRNKEKVEICFGMLCSVLSCLCAWQLEFHRLKEIKKLDDEDGHTSISFLWLVPQFCMLGFMEGLTIDGLDTFFMSRMDGSMKRYGEEYIEVLLGFGKIVNILLMLILKSKLGWIKDTINNSRLDKYYVLLACICSLNFLICWCIVKCCYEDKKEEHISDHHDSQQCA